MQMAKVERVVRHDGSQLFVSSDGEFGAWFAWHDGHASLSRFIPADKARELAAALVAAADAHDAARAEQVNEAA